MNRSLRILVVDRDARVSVGSSLCRGFRALGHDACFFDEARWIGGYSTAVWRRAVRRLFRPVAPRALNLALLGRTSAFRPDLVLVMKGFHYPVKTVAQLKKQAGAVVVYHTDDLRNPLNTNEHILQTLGLWDVVFSTRHFAPGELMEMGARNAEFLPFGYDPDLHHPSPLSSSEKNPYADMITFVGTWAPERPPVFESLLNQHKVSIWGNCWEEVPAASPLAKAIRGHAIAGEEYRRVLTNSAINVALLRKANRDQSTMRTFEIPACNGFMLAERTEEHLEYFEEDRDAVFFRDTDEMLAKADRYMKDPSARRKIAESGHKRLLADGHSYKDRAATVLRVMKERL